MGHLVRLYLGSLVLKLCGGYPIDLDSTDVRHVAVWTTLTSFLAVAVLVTSVVVLIGCICCRQNKGFQEFTDSTSSHSLSGTGGYVNSAASTTEFTIFPPVHAAAATTSSSNRLSVPGDRSSVVQFEPLPDIRLPQPHSRRPAAFNNVVTHGLSSQDWFQDPHVNFPRQQLKYLRELGRGWFGTVVEGEAQSIVPEQKTSKVVVKILHEDATTIDQMYFLHEVKPYRELDHPNILKLLGRCLETDPFLVLLEACPSGDLKSFLSQNIATADALNQQGVTLQMCCNIASGLLHMHNNGFIHTDLAARNCLVTPDLAIKIGDYGTSIETFKEDYYCAGEVALPIRWCAPETLHCTETTIETKEVTSSANVWSLGVVLWEICEFGKLPYSNLSDDEVIMKVLGEGTVRLSLPSLLCPQRQNLYLLMKLCWSSMSERPPLLQVHSMLNHLHMSQEQYNQDGDNSSLKTDEDFEHRWEMFKPNSIPKTDNHIVSSEDSPTVQSPTQSAGDTSTRIPQVDDTAPQLEEDSTLERKPLILPSAVFESTITSRDSGNLVTDGISMTPLTTSPQPSLASSSGGEFFIPALQQRHKSPSLQNLRGSIDDLSECTIEVTDATNWQKEDELDHASDVVEEIETGGNVLNEEGREKEITEIATLEPVFDSWLKGVETTNEEDTKFVHKISEALRDLDNALALEHTSSSSSSSSEASSKCVSHQSPAKDTTVKQNVVLDFRLGRADSGVSSDDKETIFQPDSLQDDSFLDNTKSTHLENRATDSGTDTEDETWRRRIEQGEFSEKVKEKSKSVADLMVLTHIECSDGSDSDPPSLTWSFERSSNGRGSFTTRLRPGSFSKNVSTAFSSESNIHRAVLGEEFKDTLKKLHEARRECNKTSKSVSITEASPHQRVDKAEGMHSETCIVHSSNHNRSENFLVIEASEEIDKENCVMETTAINEKTPVNEVVSCLSMAGPISHSNLVSNTGVVCYEVESKIDINVENCVSSYSQVPEEDCTYSSVLASRCQVNKSNVIVSEVMDMLRADVDCAAVLGAIPHEETEKRIYDNVPQKHVIESSLSNIPNSVSQLKTELSPHLSKPHHSLFSCESQSSSGISFLASDDAFRDSHNVSAGEGTEDDFLDGEYKESNLLPLFTSTPHCPYSKVGVTDSLNPTISDISDPSDIIPDLPDTVSTFCPNETLDSDTCFQPVDSLYSNNDHVSFSNTPLDSFHFCSVNDISHGQNIINDTEQVPLELNPSCGPVAVFSSHDMADSPLAAGTNAVPALSLKDNEQGSMVPTIVSDCIPSVVLGPCEDYTLDYFKGLKTTSGDEPVENISVNPEDISLHLGNSIFADMKLENAVLGGKHKPLFMDYCIDSWDRYLSTAFQEHEAKANIFDDISFKSGADSLTDKDQLLNYIFTSTSNSNVVQPPLQCETKEMSSVLENIFDFLEDSQINKNYDQVHACSKHDRLDGKALIQKTKDSVDDANITLDFMKDMNKSTADGEFCHSFNQKCLVSCEHDLGNVTVNTSDYLKGSRTNESHCHASVHLKHEEVDTSTTVPKAEERIDSDNYVACDLIEDLNVCTIIHSSGNTEPGGKEHKIESTAEESRNALTLDSWQLVQEKLKTCGLSIPTLNFIAATPIPSGRNTPEMLNEDTIELSNAEVGIVINPVLSSEQVVSNSIETEGENLLFTSKETFIDEGNEREIEIPFVLQPTFASAFKLTQVESCNLDNASGELTSVSELGIDACKYALETDTSTLSVTGPLENETNTEKCEASPETELSCSNILFYAPESAESKEDTSDLHEIEHGRPLVSPVSENTTVTSSMSTQNLETATGIFTLTPCSYHTQLLKCETGSFSPPNPQTTIITKIELPEEGDKLTLTPENASQVSQRTKVPFQNITNKENLLSLHKQDKCIPSDLIALESEKNSGDSNLNCLNCECANTISTELKHNQDPNFNAHIFKWGAEENYESRETEGQDLKHIWTPDIVKDIHKLHFEDNSVLKVSCSEQGTTETLNIAGLVSKPNRENCNKSFNSCLTSTFTPKEIKHTKPSDFAGDILSVKGENNESCRLETSNCEQISAQPIEIKHLGFETDVLEPYVKGTEENCDSGDNEQEVMGPVEMKNSQSPDLAANIEKINEHSKFFSYEQVSLELITENKLKILNPVQDATETKEVCNLDLTNFEQGFVGVIDLVHTLPSDIFNEKEANRVAATVDSWKQNQFDSNSCILLEDFLLGERLASGLTISELDMKAEGSFDAAGRVEDDGQDFGLDVVKHSTPDDERSSDSGFRDKGSLSESCEEACDEKYNLEDIEVELEDTFNKSGFSCVEKHDDEEEQNDRALEDQLRKLSASNYTEKPEGEDQNGRTLEDIERKLPIKSCDGTLYSIGEHDYCDSVHEENSSGETLKAVGSKLIVVIDSLESASKGEEEIQLMGEVTKSEIKDHLKQECVESDDSDTVKRALQLITLECDVSNHHDASIGLHQQELLTVAGDCTESVLQITLQESPESSITENYICINQINKLVQLERDTQDAELLNHETVTGKQQIATDSDMTEHLSVEDNSNRYPVTIAAKDANLICLSDTIASENLTIGIHVSDKVFAEHEIKHNVILSSLSPDDKEVSPVNGHCLISTRNCGLNAYQTFSFDEVCMNEDMSMAIDKPESRCEKPQHAESVPTTGWYLHPPLKSSNCNGYCEENARNLVNFEECTSSIGSGSCSSKYEESNNTENSYVSFSLDEEFVTAIRNELRDKLPCTRQQSQEEDLQEDRILDPDENLPQEERTDIMIHYNTYPAPLSPILEERESVSSVTTTVSDHYSPLTSSNQRDIPKSGSDSEPLSPVFVLDPLDADSRAQYEVNAKKFEQEIQEALENCSFNSEDTSSSCDKVCKESSVLFEDLEQPPSKDTQRLMLDVAVNGKNIVMVRGTTQQPDDDDDLLLVNTETNEATLLESPKPKSHLAFVNNRRTLQNSKSNDELSATPNFFSNDEMIVGMNSDTYVIDRSRFSDTFSVDSKLGAGKEVSSDDEVYTPDSISPEIATGTPSASTLQSPDTENLTDFFLTPSEMSPAASERPNSPHGSLSSSVYNPYFLHCISKDHNNPIFEEVQEISLGVANNEAAEIMSELESSGIFNNNNNNKNNNNTKNKNTNEKSIFTTLLPLYEKVSIQELPSSKISFVNENSEVLSVGDSSESSELTRKDFSDDSSNPKRLSAVDRLEYLTSPNLDVFSVKTKESTENSGEEDFLNGNSYNGRLLLNDTLDLLKRHKESQQDGTDLHQEDEEKDWSLPNLEASILSTKAPMPSPEEESWKQIPSMLAFSDLNEVMARCGSEQETFCTVSFNGPTNCVSYGSQRDVDDGDLMSTSFSIKGDPGDAEHYIPDWESDSDETNEDDNNSSSSGEFIWKEGDRESSVKAVDISATSNPSKPYESLSDFPMEVIAEEEEVEEDDDDDDDNDGDDDDDDEEDEDDEDGSSSSGSGTEFVPSAWNSEATPNRSALRSPDKKSDQKKNVSFKKQKYHSVYEYPRETSDSDSEGFDSPTHRHWNNLMLHSTQQPQVDYSSFADWELMDGDVLPEGSVPDTDMDQDIPENTTQQQLDFYKLSSVDCDFANGMVSEDGEFYISSSARPFQFPGGSSNVLTSSGSQFFPGQLYHMGSECKPADFTVDFVTPDSGIIDMAVTDKLSALEAGADSYNDEVDTSPSSISRFAVSFNDPLANRKSDSIKGIVWEDEVYSFKSGGDETSSSRSPTSLAVGEQISMESVKLQELPFGDILELAKPSDLSSNTVTNEMSSSARPVPCCVAADKDSETVSQSPSSPLSPSGLGELRHTRDRLKLDLPATSTAFVLEPPATGKRRSVETVKGEASLLDSGEETEDSGIESSNGAVVSLPREVKSPTGDTSKM